MIQEIEDFIEKLEDLVGKVKQNKSTFVSKKAIKIEISTTGRLWLQRISTSLRTKSSLAEEEINKFDSSIEKILELATGNNRKSSYINILGPLRKNLQKDILVPLIKASSTSAPLWQGTAAKVIASTISADEKNYYEEAFRAAKANCYKAAVVMTTCAFIDRLRKLVIAKGLPLFNRTSTRLKNSKGSFYSKFNKEFKFKMENELQEVFENDLVIIISGMVTLDLNQAKAILNLLSTRNSCAHPSAYVVEELDYAHFLNEVYNLILNNPKLS